MITSVPQIQSDDRVQNQTSQNIVSALNQLLKNPLVQGNFVAGVSLVNGATVVPHGLGRTPQGWVLTDVNGLATIYRSAAFNSSNLTLTSSAAVSVSLYVF